MINLQFSMNNQITNPKQDKNYDLEERTALFAEKTIVLCKKIKIDPINSRIVEQLIGSSGSIGANYCEANEAESKNDFIHKIGICKKETKETIHWLRLLKISNPEVAREVDPLLDEARQLLLIFSAISITARRRKSLKIDV